MKKLQVVQVELKGKSKMHTWNTSTEVFIPTEEKKKKKKHESKSRVLLYNTFCPGLKKERQTRIPMESSYGLNQLTTNSNNCRDKAQGLPDQSSINIALRKCRHDKIM